LRHHKVKLIISSSLGETVVDSNNASNISNNYKPRRPFHGLTNINKSDENDHDHDKTLPSPPCQSDEASIQPPAVPTADEG
jgi:hypothetical protein